MREFEAGFSWSRRSFLKGLGFLGVVAITGSLLGCRHEGKSPIAVGGPKGELAFYPDRLRSKPGEKVTWVLQSGGHTATGYHPKTFNLYQARIPEGAEPWDFDLRAVQKGASFSQTFTVEGVYNYFCRPHESVGMVGAIVVGKALDGPGLTPPQAEIPQLARQKLEELISWAKSLS